jgi:hypothetical protein
VVNDSEKDIDEITQCESKQVELVRSTDDEAGYP